MSDMQLASTWARGAARLSSLTLIWLGFSRPRLGHVPDSMSMPRPGLGWPKSTRSRFGRGDVVSLCQELVAQLAGEHSIAAVCVAVSARHFCCVMRTIGRFGRPSSTASICAPRAEIEELTERYGAAEILAARRHAAD